MDTVTTPSLPFDDSVSMLAGSSPNEASLKLLFFLKKSSTMHISIVLEIGGQKNCILNKMDYTANSEREAAKVLHNQFL